MATHYERITVNDNGKRKTFILRITSDSERFLSGYEVDNEGDEVQPRGFDRRMRVLDKTLVVKRTLMRMNLTYAILEVAR